MPGRVSGHALTLDVGGSHVTAAVVSLAQRQFEAHARRNLPHTAPLNTLMDGWMGAALEALGSRPQDLGLSHLGIAVPGPFDTLKGVSLMTHKFAALYGVPLLPLLMKRLSGTPLEALPIRFGNDADLFALGEGWAGAGRGSERLIGLTLGTGLGSGFVEHGRAVVGGPRVPPGGELWSVPWGNGVCEDLACGATLTRAWQRATGVLISARALADLAASGDERALAVFRDFGTGLAGIVAPWAERFGAQRVVLGGSVSHAFGLFGPAVQSELTARGLAGCRVLVSEHFEGAGLLGAAALGLENRASG
ncbi:ROK family protein [Deinococcus sp.]|uniref:ROK family protein n=1 Tax=Deinococcus sp. TaxID=47478 RepID=UPI003C7A3C53